MYGKKILNLKSTVGFLWNLLDIWGKEKEKTPFVLVKSFSFLFFSFLHFGRDQLEINIESIM